MSGNQVGTDPYGKILVLQIMKDCVFNLGIDHPDSAVMQGSYPLFGCFVDDMDDSISVLLNRGFFGQFKEH